MNRPAALSLSLLMFSPALAGAEKLDQPVDLALPESPAIPATFDRERAAPENSSTRVTFQDGTEITGRIVSMDPEKGTFQLDSPDLAGPTTMLSSGLLEVSLPPSGERDTTGPRALATSKPRYEGRPRDSIHGSLQAITPEAITFATDYAGSLTLQRKFIGKLEIFPDTPGLYLGPNGLAGWESSSGDLSQDWSYHNRRLTSRNSTGIARSVNIPEKAHLSFKASWRNRPNFQFLFLSNDGSSKYPRQCYRLNVQSYGVSLQRIGPGNDRDELLSNARPLPLGSIESGHFEIYLDRAPEGQNAVFLNGTRLGIWSQTDDRDGMGTHIHFIPQDKIPLEISRISIRDWNGTLPSPSTVPENSVTTMDSLEGEALSLSNGDQIIGQIQGISENTLQTRTAYGDFSIPLGKVRTIDVAGPVPDEPEPKLLPHEVRAWFHDGGFIHFQLLGISRDTVQACSQVFGKATFQLSAFSRLEFNIWRPELDLVRYGRASTQ